MRTLENREDVFNVLQADAMNGLDRYTMEGIGIPQEVLMERAALAVVSCVEKYLPGRVLCVCGGGNNGGDGIAVARILKMRGIDAKVYLCCELKKSKESVRKQYEIFCKVDGRTESDVDFSEYDIIVDAILGVGGSRPLEGDIAAVVKEINRVATLGKNIIAVDIPTGIHTDTGMILNVAVKARETITFAYLKQGHLLYPGAEYCGNVSVSDIGIPQNNASGCFTVSPKSTISLPYRSQDGNKGTFGRVLIIAGSENMYGACYLSALSALRTGCGLVTVFTHENNRGTLQTMLPETLLCTYGDTYDKAELQNYLQHAACVVIGPGLSTCQVAKQLVEQVLTTYDNAIVADADALNCIAEKKELLCTQRKFEHRNLIVTPHLGELSRLTGKSIEELKKDFQKSVKEYAGENRLIVVGKDAGTVVSDGNRTYINQTGNCGMATAGSGDVLSGIIAGLCSQKEKGFDAAWKGVFLHGKAGDVVVRNSNSYSLIAGDIADALKEAIKEATTSMEENSESL